MEKVLIIGGSGFLGSHVVDELYRRGYEVTVFDKVSSRHLTPAYKMVVGDILDRDSVRNEVKKNDIVYHFAAIADIQEAKEKPVESVTFNIIGTINILDACREFGIKRFIYSSTIYVYSDHGSFYRSSKQACELFIENYQKEYNLEFTILRYGSLYGPRANHFNFIQNIITSALLEGKIQRKGDGNELRDYINVLDAATSSVDILKPDYINTYVMITGSQTMRVREILEMISEMFQNKIRIEYLSGNFEGHYQITPYLFKPKVALKVTPENYHDLGQGILECIYNTYEQLKATGEKELISLNE
jgi:UDP-glucose 4-epimerase